MRTGWIFIIHKEALVFNDFEGRKKFSVFFLFGLENALWDFNWCSKYFWLGDNMASFGIGYSRFLKFPFYFEEILKFRAQNFLFKFLSTYFWLQNFFPLKIFSRIFFLNSVYEFLVPEFLFSQIYGSRIFFSLIYGSRIFFSRIFGSRIFLSRIFGSTVSFSRISGSRIFCLIFSLRILGSRIYFLPNLRLQEFFLTNLWLRNFFSHKFLAPEFFSHEFLVPQFHFSRIFGSRFFFFTNFPHFQNPPSSRVSSNPHFRRKKIKIKNRKKKSILILRKFNLLLLANKLHRIRTHVNVWGSEKLLRQFTGATKKKKKESKRERETKRSFCLLSLRKRRPLRHVIFSTTQGYTIWMWRHYNGDFTPWLYNR